MSILHSSLQGKMAWPVGLQGDDLQLIYQSAFQERKPHVLQVTKSWLSSNFLNARLLFLNFQCMQCVGKIA